MMTSESDGGVSTKFEILLLIEVLTCADGAVF